MANHRLSEAAAGVYVIAATPFANNGALDLESAERMVDFYLDCGVDGLTILGMMGEAPKLTGDESVIFAERVLRRCEGRAPVVVGVSGAGLRTIEALTRAVMDLGAAGVMLAPAPGLRTDEEVYGYCATVFETLGDDVPVCLQDFPKGTGVYLSVGAFLRLVADFPQLVVLKHEDCPGLKKLTRVRDESARQGLRRVAILVGNGGLYYPLELRRGADGAMTGFAYPEMLVEVHRRFRAGDGEGAEDLFDAYLPLVRYEQQPGFGLAVRKEILRRRGVIASACVRPPGPRLDECDHRELSGLLTRLECRTSDAGLSPEPAPRVPARST